MTTRTTGLGRTVASLRHWIARAKDNDLWYHFTRSPLTVAAAGVMLGFALVASLAPFLAPQNPFDVASLNISDSRLPPAWLDGGQIRYPLGTDSQGRDILSCPFGKRA